MAKPEWGRKISCTSCGTKFYDMKRETAICPSCGAENDPLITLRPKRGAAAKAVPEKKPAPPKPKVAEELDADLPDLEDVSDDLDEDLEEEEDDDLIEDTTDLGEDDDELEVVRDHLEPGETAKE